MFYLSIADRTRTLGWAPDGTDTFDPADRWQSLHNPHILRL